MLPQEVRELLNTNYFGYLCTRGDYPHITPIFFTYDQRSSIYFMTESRSKKIRNILRDNRVALVVDVRDENDPFNNEGVLITGFARVYLPGEIETEDYDIIYSTYELFKSKYSEFVEFEDRGDVLVEIKIAKVSYWKGTRFSSLRIRSPHEQP